MASELGVFGYKVNHSRHQEQKRQKKWSLDNDEETNWKLQQKHFKKIVGRMPDHMELYMK